MLMDLDTWTMDTRSMLPPLNRRIELYHTFGRGPCSCDVVESLDGPWHVSYSTYYTNMDMHMPGPRNPGPAIGDRMWSPHASGAVVRVTSAVPYVETAPFLRCPVASYVLLR